MTLTVKRALTAAAVSAGVALAAAPSAHAASTPITLTFVPPRVAPMSVVIGPVIIGGKVISPGVRVETPGTQLPTFTFTFPGWP